MYNHSPPSTFFKRPKLPKGQEYQNKVEFSIVCNRFVVFLFQSIRISLYQWTDSAREQLSELKSLVLRVRVIWLRLQIQHKTLFCQSQSKDVLTVILPSSYKGFLVHFILLGSVPLQGLTSPSKLQQINLTTFISDEDISHIIPQMFVSTL